MPHPPHHIHTPPPYSRPGIPASASGTPSMCAGQMSMVQQQRPRLWRRASPPRRSATSTMSSMLTFTAGLISPLIFLVVPPLHSRLSRFSLVKQKWRVRAGAGAGDHENVLQTEEPRWLSRHSPPLNLGYKIALESIPCSIKGIWCVQEPD